MFVLRDGVHIDLDQPVIENLGLFCLDPAVSFQCFAAGAAADAAA